ncbi:hypothetical protein D3C86_1864540 [compost metagenome]
MKRRSKLLWCRMLLAMLMTLLTAWLVSTWVWRQLLMTAIRRAAGTPWPVTSPMTRASLLSPSGRKSK